MEVASQSASPSLDAFADVVRRHQSVVCAVAYGVTGDRALSEDIAQETFVAAWRGLSTLRDRSKLSEWLRGIARNLARKSRHRARRVEELGDCAADGDLAGDTIAKDEARVTWAALSDLPEAYREALVLYYWEDLSARQVAESLGITETTVMQRLSRGRALLREEIQRLVEGTVRRARPGTVLTAAILVAVVASTAGTASAAAAVGGTSVPRGGLRYLKAWKTALALVVLAILGTVGASIAVSSGTRAGKDATHSTPGVIMARKSPGSASSAAALHDLVGSSRGAIGAHDPPLPGDEPDPDGRFMTVDVKSEGDSGQWLTDKLRQAVSNCFVEDLIDHPARIEVTIRDGKVATTTVAPFEGASARVVVMIPQDVLAPQDVVRVAIAASDLGARVAAGQPISIAHDDPQLAGHDKAMSLGELVGVCTKATLEGQPVSGPDTTHHLSLGGSRFVPKKVDAQAYKDLDVATGASVGPTSAKVTIATFLDIADGPGFGGKSVAALGEVLARYPKDVRVVVKLCPFKIPGHDLAAEAIYAASAQGALWPMLQLVAQNREHLTVEDFVGYATTLHLDATRLRNELQHHAYRAAVELDQDQMVTMDIHALPSAIVNGKRVHGAQPASAYIAAVEEALAAAQP